MTDAQIAVWERCQKELGEHFDAFVIGIASETEDSQGDIIHFCHGGGFVTAIGLFEMGKNRTYEGKRTPEEHEE